MPVHRCEEDGKPGWQWGSGKCYVYEPGDEESENEAKRRAHVQGYAAEQHGADSVPGPATKSMPAPMTKSAPPPLTKRDAAIRRK